MSRGRKQFVRSLRLAGRTAFTIVTVLVCLHGSLVAADSFSSSDISSIIGGTPFFDPNACVNGQTGDVGAQPLNGTIYIMGDSITARTEDAYQNALGNNFTNVYINGSSSRTLQYGGSGGTGPHDTTDTGLKALENPKDVKAIQQASAIVLALGTNGDTGHNMGNDIDAAINQIKQDKSSNPDSVQEYKIFWIDTYVYARSSYDSVINAANKAIYGRASADGYTVISWAKTVDPNANPTNLNGNQTDKHHYILTGDGYNVHPNIPAGTTALAGLVSVSVQSTASQASADGSTGGAIDLPGAQDVVNKAIAAGPSNGGAQDVGFALANDNSLLGYHDFENYGASITKSLILAAYLRQVANGQISQGQFNAQKPVLTKMIEISDNDSANTIFRSLKNPAASVNAVAQDAGMGNSFKLDDTSDSVYVLGQSLIDANGFAKFFSVIDQPNIIPAGEWPFAKQLLSTITPNVGLLQAGLPKPVYSKEGWKPEGSYWVVNQAGQFTINGITYGVAVTVKNTQDEGTGETIIQNVVSALIHVNTTSTTGGCCETTSSSTPPGSLPGLIPEPYNGAFTQGGNANKVAPALVAAIFTEENMTHSDPSQLPENWKLFAAGNYGGSHRPPDNVNTGWPHSGAGATGPFQFLPSTWTQYGNGGDINNLADAANGAAALLAAGGATTDKPPSSWHDAIFAYNHADWYVNAVMSYYNYYNSGSGSTNPPPGSATPPPGGCISSVNCDSSSTTTQGLSTARQNAVCVAQNELAKWKAGKMSRGFRNCTDFSGGSACDSFAKYSQNRDELWCADFVSWVYHIAGYQIGDSQQKWDVPGVDGIVAIGQGDKRWHYHAPGNYTPKPGDLAIHNNSNHVNIVVAVNGKTITFIGGDQVGPSFPDGSVVSEDTFSSDINAYISPD